MAITLLRVEFFENWNSINLILIFSVDYGLNWIFFLKNAHLKSYNGFSKKKW
jgi:hypothetical protein